MVDLEVIDISINKAVGNKITILKELDFKECVEYDKTGKWCYYFALYVKDANTKLLQDRAMELDTTGCLSKLFMDNIIKN